MEELIMGEELIEDIYDKVTSPLHVPIMSMIIDLIS